jgi:hypothetical protein
MGATPRKGTSGQHASFARRHDRQIAQFTAIAVNDVIRIGEELPHPFTVVGADEQDKSRNGHSQLPESQKYPLSRQRCGLLRRWEGQVISPSNVQKRSSATGGMPSHELCSASQRLVIENQRCIEIGREDSVLKVARSHQHDSGQQPPSYLKATFGTFAPLLRLTDNSRRSQTTDQPSYQSDDGPPISPGRQEPRSFTTDSFAEGTAAKEKEPARESRTEHRVLQQLVSETPTFKKDR